MRREVSDGSNCVQRFSYMTRNHIGVEHFLYFLVKIPLFYFGALMQNVLKASATKGGASFRANIEYIAGFYVVPREIRRN
jgi:hypothetical protein